MKRMPNINLTDLNLKLILADGMFNYGGEAVICRNNNPHTLYKIFTVPGTFDVNEMSDNKYKKVLKLYEKQL